MPIAKTATTLQTKTDDATRAARVKPEEIVASRAPGAADASTLDESDDQYDNVACTD